MTLKDGHFTLLNPAYNDERNSKPWSDYPVDDLMAAIEEYNTGRNGLVWFDWFTILLFLFVCCFSGLCHLHYLSFIKSCHVLPLTSSPPHPLSQHAHDMQTISTHLLTLPFPFHPPPPPSEYTMQSVCLQPYQIGPYLHPEGVTHL